MPRRKRKSTTPSKAAPVVEPMLEAARRILTSAEIVELPSRTRLSFLAGIHRRLSEGRVPTDDELRSMLADERAGHGYWDGTPYPRRSASAHQEA